MKVESDAEGNHSGPGGGFTIVEVMIVVAVLGLLTAIALPSISKARTDARRKQAETDLQMIATAVKRLAWDTRYAPNGMQMDSNPSAAVNNQEVADLSVAAAGLVTATATYVNWKGPYIRAINRDPWGSRYFYDPDYLIGGVNRHVVGSFGPNRSTMNNYDSDNIYVLLD